MTTDKSLVPVTKLNELEVSRLAELEATVRRTKDAFMECFMAMAEVRESRLYREKFKTFEEWGKATFGFTRCHTLRLADSGAVLKNLHGKCIQLDTFSVNENQLRPLVKVYRNNPEQLQIIWDKVEARVKAGEKRTGKLVSEVVAESDGKETKPKQKKDITQRIEDLSKEYIRSEMKDVDRTDMEKIRESIELGIRPFIDLIADEFNLYILTEYRVIPPTPKAETNV